MDRDGKTILFKVMQRLYCSEGTKKVEDKKLEPKDNRETH